MNNEAIWRLVFFISILVIMMLLEWQKPARQSPVDAKYRWVANFGLVFISSVVARLTVPLGLTALAMYNTERGIGLFNVIELPLWLSITISLLLLDILIYWQHRLFHRVPLLWRMHRVHHADSHIDASTGLRFHPLEIVLSILIKLLAVTVIGVPVIAVLIFEIALNGFALFNHANIRLPNTLEKRLRHVIVTQQLHRIHHSQTPNETNSNFGFSVIWWDKLFASYKPHANETDATLKVGLSQYTATKKNASIITLLLMPFK